MSISTYGVCSFIQFFIQLFLFHLIFQLIVSWTGHLVIFSNNLIDFIDSFNVTVKWIETLFPESKPEVDKIYSDVQSFGKAMQSNLYVYDQFHRLPHSLH